MPGQSSMGHARPCDALVRVAFGRRSLDRGAFAREVKRALRRLDRPDLLVRCALMETSLVADDDGGPSRRAERLQKLLLRVCAAVRDEDDDLRGWQTLERTYIRPAVKQLAAADELGLSYATYRRALAGATERVVERLWAIEKSTPVVRLVRSERFAPPTGAPEAFRRRIAGALSQLAQRGELDDRCFEQRLRRSLDLFAESPRDADVYRVVHETFFDRSGPQHVIARRLRLPYGTYRRYLSHGVDRIATALWLEEHG